MVLRSSLLTNMTQVQETDVDLEVEVMIELTVIKETEITIEIEIMNQTTHFTISTEMVSLHNSRDTIGLHLTFEGIILDQHGLPAHIIQIKAHVQTIIKEVSITTMNVQDITGKGQASLRMFITLETSGLDLSLNIIEISEKADCTMNSLTHKQNCTILVFQIALTCWETRKGGVICPQF